MFLVVGDLMRSLKAEVELAKRIWPEGRGRWPPRESQLADDPGVIGARLRGKRLRCLAQAEMAATLGVESSYSSLAWATGPRLPGLPGPGGEPWLFRDFLGTHSVASLTFAFAAVLLLVAFASLRASLRLEVSRVPPIRALQVAIVGSMLGSMVATVVAVPHLIRGNLPLAFGSAVIPGAQALVGVFCGLVWIFGGDALGPTPGLTPDSPDPSR